MDLKFTMHKKVSFVDPQDRNKKLPTIADRMSDSFVVIVNKKETNEQS